MEISSSKSQISNHTASIIIIFQKKEKTVTRYEATSSSNTDLIRNIPIAKTTLTIKVYAYPTIFWLPGKLKRGKNKKTKKKL